MKKFYKPLLFVAAVGLFLVSGCSKTTELGLSLVELERSDIVYTDTISLEMSTITTTPFSTTSAGRWLCGSYEDPIFGYTETGTYFNFYITTTGIEFDSSTYDSIVLALHYDTIGHYGDVWTSSPSVQTWDVYRLAADLTESTSYPSDTTIALGTALASNFMFVPNVFDSILVDTTRSAPQARIRLDDAFGQSLFAPTDTTIYASNTNFKNFFKGLYIKPTSGATNTSILRFFSDRTKLILYYTEIVDGVPTRKTFEYYAGGSDAQSAIVAKHDYTSTSVLSNNPTDTVVYVQGANGSTVKVLFPHLDSLGNVIINKAELLLYSPVAPPTAYPLPSQLVAVEWDGDDSTYTFVDDLSTSISKLGSYSLFGGKLERPDSFTYLYRMNVSSYMQRILAGDVADNALYIQALTILDPARITLGNQRSQSAKVKLLLTYTKVD